jgi:hypothetical protein
VKKVLEISRGLWNPQQGTPDGMLVEIGDSTGIKQESCSLSTNEAIVYGSVCGAFEQVDRI